MSIGGGIALIVIGAILVFGLHVVIPGVSLIVIGYILIAAGIVVFLIGLAALFRRRRSTVVSRAGVDDRGEAYERVDRAEDDPTAGL